MITSKLTQMQIEGITSFKIPKDLFDLEKDYKESFYKSDRKNIVKIMLRLLNENI